MSYGVTGYQSSNGVGVNLAKSTFSPYALEASLWNNQIASGELNAAGISQRVAAGAHNQSVYVESLTQRLAALAAKPLTEKVLGDYADVRNEIWAVQAASAGQPWAAAFNATLDGFAAQAQAPIDASKEGV